MDFFGIGPLELVLILVIALMVFGPGKLPELARQLGRAAREFRKASSELTHDFKQEFEKELNAEPTKPEKPAEDPGAVDDKSRNILTQAEASKPRDDNKN
jgi:TatA/E family protein of Tat protein translocase